MSARSIAIPIDQGIKSRRYALAERHIPDFDRFARADVPVLLIGATGTGKENAARTIHDLSSRASQPFLPINCAGLSEYLMEAELFGHAKGAFTGAAEKKRGLFDLANGGTVFLDELQEMPLLQQAKLLRVLEEKKVRPLGATQPVPVDIRFIGALNCDPQKLIREGKLRLDFYQRLAIGEMPLKPLREMPEEIQPLTEFLLEEVFLEQRSKIPNLVKKSLPSNTRQLIQLYPWPGNIRELKNALLRAMIINPSSPCIEPADLRINVSVERQRLENQAAESLHDISERMLDSGHADLFVQTLAGVLHESGLPLDLNELARSLDVRINDHYPRLKPLAPKSLSAAFELVVMGMINSGCDQKLLEQAERACLVAALTLKSGNITHVSQLLGVSTKTIKTKMQIYQLSAKDFKPGKHTDADPTYE